MTCAEATSLFLGYCAHRNQCDLFHAPRCALWLHLSGNHRCPISYSLLSRHSREGTKVRLDLDDLLRDHHHSAWDSSWLGFVSGWCSTERSDEKAEYVGLFFGAAYVSFGVLIPILNLCIFDKVLYENSKNCQYKLI